MPRSQPDASPSFPLAKVGRRQRWLLWTLRWYPPFLGAGVRVRRMAEDLTSLEVEMKLRWWNRNYVGTHFGGSLYSMCDPFLMIMLMQQLGPGFVVWDKAASIRFRRPGRGTVRARFELPREEVERIRRQAFENPTVEPTFTILVKGEQDELVAEVDKRLYVRRKQPRDEARRKRTGEQARS